jgi:hypothetical protein
MGIEKGEEIQTKGKDNLFSNIIVKNFPNLEKGKDIQVQEVYPVWLTKPSGPEKEHLQIYHNQNTQFTEQRILKAPKEK